MHVLSLPPAFVLSQDQTLKLKNLIGFLWSKLFNQSKGYKHKLSLTLYKPEIKEFPSLVTLESTRTYLHTNLTLKIRSGINIFS
uniref:Uncharacterized protein n=1 Tax=Bartonella rochalimae ATCC BAA-1498 TaxID=685782 RepID=E6YN31_9HYPH|nr:conserved hypothetical protein [Bartonella rochalimae ATCC BAA-1498]